jgi:hypothetical protein
MELLLTGQRSALNDEQCIKVLDVGLLMGKSCVSKIRIDAPFPRPITEQSFAGLRGENRASRK